MTHRATVYLDYAAATPCSAAVVAAMQPYLTEHFYNPSSAYAPAVQVRRDVEEARRRIAQTIGARPADIIFTAGATESINLAMTAAESGHIVTAAIEHQSVLRAAEQHEHTVVQSDHYGVIAPETIAAAIRPHTRVISIGLANSEIGTIQPLRHIAAIVQAERVRRRDAGETTPLWLHTDASQGVGRIDINTARLGIDMMTLNAAKCYGPKQVGLLWKKSDVRLRSIAHGGGQEQGLRSGTENVAGIMGFAVALERADMHRKREAARFNELQGELERRLRAAFPDMIVSGHPKKRLPGHLHVAFEGIDAERLIFLLEADGVYVATGSACAANSGVRSHVLEAIGLTPSQADGSLRLTLGEPTTLDDVIYASDRIIAAVQRETERTS